MTRFLHRLRHGHWPQWTLVGYSRGEPVLTCERCFL